MTDNEIKLYAIFSRLFHKLQIQDFVTDKSGVKMVELIGEKIILDPTQKILDFGVRKTKTEYVEREIAWYDSLSLNIERIAEFAKIWYGVSDDDGYVNSNYGWMIYSDDNYNQYQNCLKELKINRESRRAVMIYQRPSIWDDAFRNNRDDFICTDGVQCFIRNNVLIYIIKQRSCDMIFGFFNDFYWHCVVYDRLLTDLRMQYPELNVGWIEYFPFSLHIYERHFQLLSEIYDYGTSEISRKSDGTSNNLSEISSGN